jgi:hypothetical protein
MVNCMFMLENAEHSFILSDYEKKIETGAIWYSQLTKFHTCAWGSFWNIVL